MELAVIRLAILGLRKDPGPSQGQTEVHFAVVRQLHQMDLVIERLASIIILGQQKGLAAEVAVVQQH